LDRNRQTDRQTDKTRLTCCVGPLLALAPPPSATTTTAAARLAGVVAVVVVVVVIVFLPLAPLRRRRPGPLPRALPPLLGRLVLLLPVVCLCCVFWEEWVGRIAILGPLRGGKERIGCRAHVVTCRSIDVNGPIPAQTEEAVRRLRNAVRRRRRCSPKTKKCCPKTQEEASS
jgi:hypothetical protein